MEAKTGGRLYQVVSEVFGISKDEIGEESSPDTIPGWDSVSHINMVLSIEAEFGVPLTPEDAMEMMSIKLIRMILEEKGVKDI